MSLTTRVKTRVRIGFSRTQKDGWDFDDTVEVEWEGDDPDSDKEGLYRLGELIKAVRAEAQAERDDRNRFDLEYKRDYHRTVARMKDD